MNKYTYSTTFTVLPTVTRPHVILLDTSTIYFDDYVGGVQ